MSGIQPREPRGLGQPGPYPRAHGHPGGATSSNPYGPAAGNPFGSIAGNPYGGAHAYSPTLHLTPSGETVLAGPDLHQRHGYPPGSRVRVVSSTGKNGAYVMSYPSSSGSSGFNFASHHVPTTGSDDRGFNFANRHVPTTGSGGGGSNFADHYVPTSGSDHHFHPTPSFLRSHQNLHGEPTGDWELASALGTNKAKKGSATALPSQQASRSGGFFGSGNEKDIELCELEAALQECAMGKKHEKHNALTDTHSSLGSDSSTDNLALTPGSTPPAPSTKVTGALNDSAASDKSSKVRIRLTAPETRATYERLLAAFHATTVERFAQIKEPADKLAYITERQAYAKTLAAAAAAAAPGKSTKTGGLSDDDRYEEVPITFSQPKAEARLNRSYDDLAAEVSKPTVVFSLGSKNQHSVPAAEIPKPKVVVKAAPHIHRQQSVPAAAKEEKLKVASKAQFLLLKKVLLNRLPDIEKAYAEGDAQHQRKVRAAMLTLLDSHVA